MTFQEVYDEATHKEPLDIPNDGDWCSIGRNITADWDESVKNRNYYKWDTNHRNKVADVNDGYYPDGVYTKPKKVRCPKCRRYLTPKVIDHEPGGSFDPGLKYPPHKVKSKDRIKNQKARKKTSDKGYVR